MVRPTTKLSEHLPPLIFGTATFTYQFNPDPYALGPNEIVQHALAHGVRAFDTSPYYGPAEEILGHALAADPVRDRYPRDQYYILTKVGRIASDTFDYSPVWVRHSVKLSCRRFNTTYLDVVYCHDVEFVSPEETLTAIKELRRIRDDEGTVKYVGISGYPVDVLADLAEMVLCKTGEPLDAVMSYANFTLQNTRLSSKALPRLIQAGVDVVPNASPLAMGLLRRQGVPIGAMGNWHPAPDKLREACLAASNWVDSQGEKLEVVAGHFALENWLRDGAKAGTRGYPFGPPPTEAIQPLSRSPEKLGVSVIGVSKIEELDETIRVWRSVLDSLAGDLDANHQGNASDAVSDHEWSLQRRHRMRVLAKGARVRLGDWVDFAWASPSPGFVNRPNTDAASIEEEKITSTRKQIANGHASAPKTPSKV